MEKCEWQVLLFFITSIALLTGTAIEYRNFTSAPTPQIRDDSSKHYEWMPQGLQPKDLAKNAIIKRHKYENGTWVESSTGEQTFFKNGDKF